MVLVVPGIADEVPHPGRDDQARYALTCLGIVAVTAAFVFVRRGGAERGFLPTLAYGTGLAVVKFILSPSAFTDSADVTLGTFVASGLAVIPLYVSVIALLYRLARGSDPWAASSKLATAVALGAAAVATRYAVSFVIGTTSDYVDSLTGAGLVLPVVIALASFAVMEAFDRARPSLAAAAGEAVVIVLVHHALWVAYMYRLF